VAEISSRIAIERSTYLGPDIWALPVVGAIVYPLLVKGFILSVEAYKANDVLASKVVLAAVALAFMSLELAVPLMALRALMRIRDRVEPNAPLLRRVLHLAFATPPAQTLSGFAADAVGISPAWAWYGGWAVLAMIALLARSGSRSALSGTPRAWARIRAVHGASALFLIVGFLSLHLGNHLTALWTVHAQQVVMTLLRGWYRSDWVQPVILVLFGTIIVTGILMVRRYTASTADSFRTLQTASGAYFAAFIGSHTLAVFIGRANNVDTNWDFAAGGPLGLLHQAWRGSLIDYYALSVFLIIVHVALGLRIVLLGHGTKEGTANRVVYAGVAAGALVTSLIMAAALGLHLGS
jgi:hypothetical protein